MELITILNRCHRFRGFVPASPPQCRQEEHRSSRTTAQGFGRSLLALHLPAPGYDQLAERRFEFIPLWGFLVSFCTPCAASTVAAAALWLSKKFPGATANAH
jgi:hypothetical protein